MSDVRHGFRANNEMYQCPLCMSRDLMYNALVFYDMPRTTTCMERSPIAVLRGRDTLEQACHVARVNMLGSESNEVVAHKYM